jgi:hypothetical protein
MKNNLLKVENVLKIPKTYISRQFGTISRGSKGHSATSDDGREGGRGSSVPIHVHPKAGIGRSANRNNNNVGGIGGGGGNDNSVPQVISKTLAYKLRVIKEEIMALQEELRILGPSSLLLLLSQVQP